MESPDTPRAPLDNLIELLEAIWVQIDPNQEAEWREALKGKDPDVAEQAIIVLRDASKIQPSVKLFDATYRGLKSRKTEAEPRQTRAEWFDQQRAVLRRVASRPESSSRS